MYELARLVPHRKGTFTTNILADVASHPVALYFTGWQHAGENLAAVLRQRAADLAPPIQMCDALSRNVHRLYSRKGFFYKPFLPFPEANWVVLLTALFDRIYSYVFRIG